MHRPVESAEYANLLRATRRMERDESRHAIGELVGVAPVELLQAVLKGGVTLGLPFAVQYACDFAQGQAGLVVMRHDIERGKRVGRPAYPQP